MLRFKEKYFRESNKELKNNQIICCSFHPDDIVTKCGKKIKNLKKGKTILNKFYDAVIVMEVREEQTHLGSDVRYVDIIFKYTNRYKKINRILN